MIRGVSADRYPAERDCVWPFLANFAARDLDGMTADELEAGILSRDRQLWAIANWQACALSMVTREAVRITHCAGYGRETWQDALDEEMREWARAIGKPRLVMLARPGWSRAAQARGWREHHREMSVEV